MVKRLFWMALGAAVGVTVVSKGSKALRRLSPAGLADSASGALGRFAPAAIGDAVQGFAEDVSSAAAEREFELYRALGMDVPEDPR
jgi:hypothetical protein